LGEASPILNFLFLGQRKGLIIISVYNDKNPVPSSYYKTPPNLKN
jgi:hypothetical protein